MPENPVKQVFETYNKNLSTLEEELTKLIAQKEALTKEKTPNKKQLKNITEKISDTKREIFKKKHQYKLSGAEQEKENREYLIAIQSDREWYKFTHHSACFFMTDIQPRLKNSARFHLYPDTDNYGYSPHGVISLKLNKDLINELNVLKITEEKSDIDGIRRFKLPWKYTEKRFQKITEDIEKDLSKIDSILIPKVISPQLFKQIEDLNKATYYVAKSISEPLAKNSLGKDLFMRTTNLILIYLALANGKTDITDSCKKMLDELNGFCCILKVLLDLDIVKYHDGLRLSGFIVQIRNTLKAILNGVANAKKQ